MAMGSGFDGDGGAENVQEGRGAEGEESDVEVRG